MNKPQNQINMKTADGSGKSQDGPKNTKGGASDRRSLPDFGVPDDVAESITETVGTTIPDSIGSTIWPMTTSGILMDRWERAWDALNGLPRTGFFETMVSRYTEPKRHYHTMQHLAECFEAFDKISHHCDQPYEVEMAIWFHDVIYDTARHDNEEKSAELAFQSLTKSGVELLSASRVSKLVLSTQHKNPPHNIDSGILIDVDLWILGAPHDRFLQYENQIRWEYTAFSDEAYIHGRTQFVARLLRKVKEGGMIFKTPEFRDQFEKQAVKNLQGSLKRLKAGILPVRLPMMISDGFQELGD
jgi:predicted metal-dependent HD superfamily phosphohydrolase